MKKYNIAQMGKKALSLFLVALMLLSANSAGFFGVTAVASLDFAADEHGSIDVSVGSSSYKTANNVVIGVPETIYMTPSIGESVSGQYYVNNIVDEEGNITLEAKNDATSGIISIYAPGATAFSLDVTACIGNMGDPVIGESSDDASASLENGQIWNFGELGEASQDYVCYDGAKLFINGTGLSNNTVALIQWAITIYYNASQSNGVTYYAYSTLYSPSLIPVGAALRVKAKATEDVFVQDISWISGVHSVNESTDLEKRKTPNRLPSSEGKGMVGFLGTDNSAYVNNAPVEGISGSAGDMYAVFATNDASTSYFWAGQTGSSLSDEGQGCADWFNGSTSFNIYSFDWYNQDMNPDSNYLSALLYSSASGKITIDTGRYTNLNQIPNLGIGLLVTDNDGGRSASWYVSDFSDSYEYGKVTDYWQRTDSDSTRYFPEHGTILGGLAANDNYSDFNSSLQGDSSTGLKYAGSWDRELKTGANATYSVKTFYGSKNKNSTHAMAYAFIDLNATQFDKNELRKLILQATSLNRKNYTTGTWNVLQAALQDSAYTLGNPTATADDVTKVQSNLESKLAALKSSIKLNANGGKLSSTSYSATMGASETVEISAPTAKPTREGYTFLGWATSPVASNPSKTTVWVGLNDTLFAIWSPEETNVTFDNLIDIDGWLAEPVTDGAITERTEAGFTLVSDDDTPKAVFTSAPFSAEPEKEYKLDVDVTGKDWAIYVIFSDANGNWLEDEPTAITSGFIVPEGTAQAQLRVVVNGNDNSVKFSNFCVYEDRGIIGSHNNTHLKSGETIGELPVPQRDGYNFLGWVDTESRKQVTADTVVASQTMKLKSVWFQGELSLQPDKAVIDFSLPIKIDVLENDGNIKNEDIKLVGLSTSANGTPSQSLNGRYGTFTVSDGVIVYKIGSGMAMNDAETPIYYHVEVDIEGIIINLSSTLKVLPASNVYYEESAIFKADGGSSQNNWTAEGAALNEYQDTSDASAVYGYNEAYASSTGFSNGTYYKVTATANKPLSAAASFEFIGTGFDLIGACGETTGVQVVRIQKWNGTAYKTIKLCVVDTYHNGTLAGADGLLHQAPVLTYHGEGPAEKYRVEAFAAYLDSDANTSAEIINDIKVFGFDDTENIEVLWMDDNSAFNGGTASVGLTSYIDGFRVYRNGGSDYVESEQNPTYYSIVDGVADDASSENFDRITGDLESAFGEAFAYENYLDSNSPKGEIHLEEGQAIAFTFSAEYIKGKTANIMLGMRQIKGSVNAQVTAITDGNAPKSANIDVNSETEMYYDVSDAVKVSGEDGTVTILIANTGDGVLAVNNLKLVNGTLKSGGTILQSGSNAIAGGAVNAPALSAPEAEENVENNADSSSDGGIGDITSMLPGMPESVSSFLEMLFKLLAQLLGSFGF